MAMKIPGPPKLQAGTLLTNASIVAPNWSLPPKPYASPNWRKWLSMPEVELWQAVALSCNIEPLDYYPTGLDDDFDERMDIALAHLVPAGLLNHISVNSRPHISKVTLADVARLAKSCRWSVSAEFLKAEAPTTTQAALLVNKVPLSKYAMQSHWDKLTTIRVIDAGYLLAGMEPERKWQYAPPLVANFFNLIREKTSAVKLATMPGERMEITQAEFQALKAEYGITPAIEPQATTPSPAPVPVAATNASGGMEPAKAGPLPLTTGDVAFCFAGLSWNEQEWKKPLGDKPKWLSACIAIPAVRGVSESRWNPVLIGASLVRVRHVKPKSVRAKFQTQPLLKPWLDEWKTYEADNLSAD